MAQYASAMPQWIAGPHSQDVHHQNQPRVASNGQDPRKPSQQPVIHVVGDVRPRLTKEQHDILEAHFQQQNKPTTNTKKGFAESLGVPLDKINNWFQNRRAKVKQDAKKQMNAIHMYHQQLAMAQMNNQPPPQSLEFFAANSHLDTSVFASAVPRPVDANNPNCAVPHPPQLMGPLGSISESHHPASSEDIMLDLESSGYALEGMDMNAVAHRPYLNFEASDEFMFNPQFNMVSSVQDFAQYEVQHEHQEGIEFPNYGVALSPSNDSTPSIPSTLSSMQSNSTVASSINRMPVPNVSTDWTEDGKPTIQFSPSPNEMPSASNMPQNAYSSPPEEQSAFWPRNQHPNFEQHFAQADTPRPTSAHDLPPTPPQFESKSRFGDELDPNSTLSRRPSSTTGLAESMNNVDLQARSKSVDSGFKQPDAPSSLAARRQRPRPAALGQAALRSTSHSVGIPASPGTNVNLNAPADHSLRRIRSSGVPGVANGRIQKACNGTSQRSPLNLSFADAAASPKFARHASYAAITSPRATTLAPPTPLTPKEVARFPSWQSHHDSVHPHNSIDHSSPNGVAMSWTSQSPAIFPAHATSPPETPLDPDQYHPYMGSVIYRDTPPQSAPATQQCFSIAPPPSFPQALVANHAHLSHVRRPSLPDSHMIDQPMSMHGFHQPTGDMPLTFQSMPYDRLHVPHPHVTVPSQTTAAYPTPPHPAPASIAAQSGVMLPADFPVHEYTPPSAAGRVKDSASPTTRDFDAMAPKIFHFANAGPKDFQGQLAT